MRRYALIGRRLGHSWSQRWFEALFERLGLDDHTYSLHETESLDSIRQWIEREDIAGFNVTIPYKEAIVPLLDGLDAEAEAIGAVNCVSVEHGRLVGHNTDAPAFGQTLSEAGLPEGSIFVLGTGGAAHAVGHALDLLGKKWLPVSRHPEAHRRAIGYGDLTPAMLEEAALVVNATPVGMHPDSDRSPLDLSGVHRMRGLVYDLVYNPSPTLLLRQATARGARTADGLAMLHRQAELSWAIWRGKNQGI